jgi:RNA polymerase sigma-70 factor (ECF subfamily)
MTASTRRLTEVRPISGEHNLPAPLTREAHSRSAEGTGLSPSGIPAGPTDEELVALAAAGRREAFEELVRRHADRLYAVVLRFTGDPGEAEEVVQEAFLRAWRGIARFERRSQFFTWLYRIGLNEAKRRAGRRPVAEPLSVEEGALEQTADFSHAPEPRAEQHDLREVLERAVRALPEGYRAPLILRDVEGLSTEQAAAIMGLKEAAFKSRLHRARLAVRDAVAPYLAGDDQ